TPVSFSFSVVTSPMGPVLLTTMEINPDLPMRGWSRSRIVSPVISHHLQIWLPTGCPAPGNPSRREGQPVADCSSLAARQHQLESDTASGGTAGAISAPAPG